MKNAKALRAQIATLSLAMTDFDPDSVQSVLRNFMAPDATVHLCHPFGDIVGPQALYDLAYAPLLIACLLYTSPSPRDVEESRMPSSA